MADSKYDRNSRTTVVTNSFSSISGVGELGVRAHLTQEIGPSSFRMAVSLGEAVRWLLSLKELDLNYVFGK